MSRNKTFECPDGLGDLFDAHVRACAQEASHGNWGAPDGFISSPFIDVFPLTRGENADDEAKVAFGRLEALSLTTYTFLRDEIVKMLKTPPEDGGENNEDGNDEGAANRRTPPSPAPTPDEASSIKAYLAHSRFVADEMAQSLVVVYQDGNGARHAVIVGRRFQNDAFLINLGERNAQFLRTSVNTDNVLLRYWGKRAWVRVLQERFCKIGGDYFEHFFDEHNVLQKHSDKKAYFVEKYANKRMWCTNDAGGINHSNPFKAFIAGNMREFTEVAFDPGMPPGDRGSSVFNLWRGFAIKPRRPAHGSEPCPKILYHIREVLCNDAKRANIFLNTLALIHRHPDRISGIKPLFVSAQGVGKSSGLVDWLLAPIWGPHLIVIANKKLLSGHFNAHLECAVIVIDEECSFCGDKEYANAEKARITGEAQKTQTKKSKDTQTNKRSFCNEWGFSNSKNATHMCPKTRRKMVMRCSERYIGDQQYFVDLKHECDNGGREEFLWYMLEGRDVPHDFHPGFAVQKLGLNDESVDQMFSMHSATILKWFREHLASGTMRIGGGHLKNNGGYVQSVTVFQPGQPTIVEKRVLMRAMQYEFENDVDLRAHGRKNEDVQFPSNMMNQSNAFTRAWKALVGQTAKNGVRALCTNFDTGNAKTHKPWRWRFAPVETIRASFARIRLNAKDYAWPEIKRSADAELAQYHLDGIAPEADVDTMDVATALKSANLWPHWKAWCKKHEIGDSERLWAEAKPSEHTNLLLTLFEKQNREKPATVEEMLDNIAGTHKETVANSLKGLGLRAEWEKWKNDVKVYDADDAVWGGQTGSMGLGDIVALLKEGAGAAPRRPSPREEAPSAKRPRVF